MRSAMTEAYLNYTAKVRDEWSTVENFFETARIIWISDSIYVRQRQCDISDLASSFVTI